MDSSSESCTREILETVPLVMQAIRTEMRRHRSPSLSVTEFRALVFLDRHAGASLVALSDHLGLASATVSRMIDGMVATRFVARRTCPEDRRRITLGLTAAGRSTLGRARHLAQVNLSILVSVLQPEERQAVIRAMQVLRALFADYAPTPAGGPEG
jgi:DNA-binding MarR family transcriptional regulator